MIDQNNAVNFSDERAAELREAMELLFFSYRAFTRGPDRMLEKRGLNRVHHRVLYFVARQPGLSVNDLLSVLDVSKQALHIPLRQLVSMKLVQNDKSKLDGRVRELRLTSAGKRLEARLTGTQQLQLQSVFEEAGKDAEKAWRKTMRLLAQD